MRAAVPWYLRPGEPKPLSTAAASLVERVFRGLDRARVWDMHCHVIGNAHGGNGCWVNPDMRSHLHPILRLQFDSYLAASDVDDWESAEPQFLDRLLALHRDANPEGRLVVLSFDWFRDERGEPDRERSIFHVPDAYVLDLAKRHADVEACVSIHPYAKDAVDRVHAAHEGGALAVKWLPNAQGIDPASDKCDAFYRAMEATDMVLLAHAGGELAVASEFHELANPLSLRRPLDRGVRTVIAHVASTGKNVDLDRGGADPPKARAFDLALRVLRDPAYRGLAWADISAMTLISRSGRPLRETLLATDLHDRIVNGSDYPIPAIAPLVSTWKLVRGGLLASEDRRRINEIYDRNPLLADFVLKRCLRAENDVGGKEKAARFSNDVFETARLFDSVTAKRDAAADRPFRPIGDPSP